MPIYHRHLCHLYLHPHLSKTPRNPPGFLCSRHPTTTDMPIYRPHRLNRQYPNFAILHSNLYISIDGCQNHNLFQYSAWPHLWHYQPLFYCMNNLFRYSMYRQYLYPIYCWPHSTRFPPLFVPWLFFRL